MAVLRAQSADRTGSSKSPRRPAAAAAGKAARKAPAGAERRREDRSSVKVPVLYHVEDGVEERVSATLNLSHSGLQFPSRRSLDEGARLRMRLLIPGEIRPVVLHGVVRWCRKDEQPGQFQLGVSFERGEAPMRRTLRKFLEPLETSTSRPESPRRARSPRAGGQHG